MGFRAGAFDPDDLDPSDRIFRELGNQPRYSAKKRKTPKKFHGSGDKTPKIAPASDRLLKIAEHFVAVGVDYGYESVAYPPWLSHQIARKEAGDKMIQAVIEKDVDDPDPFDRADRLLLKMCDLYWKEYAEEGTKSRKIVFDFLDECWEDLRDYAHRSLRGAYARKHGKWRKTMDYIDEMASHAQEDRAAIRQARITAYAEWERRQPVPEIRPRPSMVEARARLAAAIAKRQETV